jgi:predicted transcriptional regulator of viral defense system
MTQQARLWDIAVEQDGYVTTDDARDLGIPAVELRKLALRGTLEHEAHGVYRFTKLPITPTDRYRLAVLWTGNRKAVLSHETALDVYELCDINPDGIDVTVPQAARIRRENAHGVRLFREDLDDTQLGWWNGIRCVTERTAIIQTIEMGTPVYLVNQAIDNARNTGRITESDKRAMLHRIEEKYGY